ncbi:MAG: 23S rRNA (uracil(1939)-C(5))-methyltransferase RlmD [Firmicutes bacterium]|nr:23S rRNA (uracil(1939)-C(5))-methyltransferase RlmD [Candidatus Fermentithermobacillaceae bacterium]
MRARAEIRSFSHRGEGAGVVVGAGSDLSGITVFVPGTVPGDLVEIQVLEKKRNYARGKLLEVLREGPGRTQEVCPVAARCGGCSWQHLRYDLQLYWKETILREALHRIGKSPECEVKAAVPSPKVLGYRNKVEVPLQVRQGKVVAGFYEPYSHRVVPSEECPLEHPLARELVAALLAQVRKRGYSIYDEKTGKGHVRHIVARIAPGTGERMGMLVSTTVRLPGALELAKEVMESVQGVKSMVLNVNREMTNVILGNQWKLLAGRWYVEDVMSVAGAGSLRFRIGPGSFYQVNSEQAATLYKIALDACEISSADVVYDVYSGIGTMTLFASKKARFCVGIEEAERSVMDAKVNARLNGVDNVAFVAGKAERVLPSVLARFGRPSVVLLDPPRAGLAEDVIPVIVRSSPRTIVYVSCNPSTLCRDVARFKELGYLPEWAIPVDMFPMTPHVESVVKLKRSS